MISSRFFSKGPIPTSSTAEVGGVKVIGLDHLSVRCHDAQVEPRVEVSDQPSLTLKNMTIVALVQQTPSMRWTYRKKNWLSQPETYPLLAILGGAGVFVAGFITYFLITAPDVQISPIKR
jgi:hypothetical protein